MLRLKKKIGHVLVAMVAATSLYTASFTAIAPHVAYAEAENDGELLDYTPPGGDDALESTVPSAATITDAPNIKTNQDVSLTVTKYGGDGSSCAIVDEQNKPVVADGKPYNGTKPNSCNQLAGVEFKATEILFKDADHPNGRHLDLTTVADWLVLSENASSLTVEMLKKENNVFVKDGTSKVQATNSNGVTKFPRLGKTVYLVEESDPGENLITKPIKPFLITLPLLNTPSDKTPYWVYDVHIYPKNELGASPHKSVKELLRSNIIGLETDAKDPIVKWRTSVSIPAPAQDTTRSKAEFVDKFPVGLTYVDDSAKIYVADTADASSGTTVTPKVTKPTDTDANGALTIAASSDELGKVAAGKYLIVEFKTTMSDPSSEAAFLHIQNSGTFKFDSLPDKTTRCDKNECAHLFWGQVKIQKRSSTDKADTEKFLAGAKFEVITPSNTTPLTDQSTNDDVIAACKQDGASKDANTVTTDSNGVVQTKFFVSSGTSATPATAFRWYCLKEVTPPIGYQFDKNNPYTPVKVVYDANATSPTTVTIANTPVNSVLGLTLPLTGAAGQLTLLILAIASASLGGVFIIISRRRKQNKL